MRSYDLTVIGGGIVGMATAMSAQRLSPWLRILVLEKESSLATHQTGHNSGVIHSGIYYRPGSLKAQMCVRGRNRIVEFCRQHGLAHEICGKVIVATSNEEASRLPELLSRAKANDVPGVRRISREELREFEPHAAGVAALLVPSTGIVDYAEVTKKYASLFCEMGGVLELNAEAAELISDNTGIIVRTKEQEFRTGLVVNCAGLQSDRIAKQAGASIDLSIVPFRGEYYRMKLDSTHLVRNLIYPVPNPRLPFLGVHFTRRINGEIEAGPNAVLSLKREGYRKGDIDFGDLTRMIAFPGFWRMTAHWWRTGIHELRHSFIKAAFVRALQALLPELRSQDIEPSGSGVRAQAVSKEGKLLDDFCILRKGRVIHVCNVPSPAATASLEIGETVAKMAVEHFQEYLPAASLGV